jgi:ribonuclease P protein component
VTKEPSATLTPSRPPGGERSFPRSCRILRSADFRIVYDHGFRVSGPLFTAFCKVRAEEPRLREDESTGPRLGLTVPRAIGGAVIRNRIKRRLREAFRLQRSALQPRWDIVLNPRRAALDAAFGDIQRELGKLIEKCNSR